MPRTFDWTEERLGLAMKLARENLSASEIGRQLGTTRNSVVGKLHRLGLKLTSKPYQPAQTGNKASRAAAQKLHEAKAKAPITLALENALAAVAPAQASPAPVAESAPTQVRYYFGEKPGPGPVNLMDLREHHCRAPLWKNPKPSVSEMLYCGQPAVNGPYCLQHRQIFCISVPAFRGRPGQRV